MLAALCGAWSDTKGSHYKVWPTQGCGWKLTVETKRASGDVQTTHGMVRLEGGQVVWGSGRPSYMLDRDSLEGWPPSFVRWQPVKHWTAPSYSWTRTGTHPVAAEDADKVLLPTAGVEDTDQVSSPPLPEEPSPSASVTSTPRVRHREPPPLGGGLGLLCGRRLRLLDAPGDLLDPCERPEEGEDQERLALSRGLLAECETYSIAPLSDEDDVPLGTDTDPENGYRNLWAAGQASDDRLGLLVESNLGCVVIDAENVGISYGKEVNKGQPGQTSYVYSGEGVCKAVQYYTDRGVHAIVVAKASSIMRDGRVKEMEGDAVEVVLAERTDDIMVLKMACERNCPIVSRDGFRDWQQDPRLDRELRRWLLEKGDLQVRFFWGPRGRFMPDLDLPRPTLRPQEPRRHATCSKCLRDEDERFGEWAEWRGEWLWYCAPCHRDWQSWWSAPASGSGSRGW